MRLDGLLAEEQLGRDLGVRLAVDDEAGELKLSVGERLDAAPVGVPGAGAPMRAAAELSQFSLGAVPVAHGAAGLESCRRAPKLVHRAIALADIRQRSAGKRPRERVLDRCSDVTRGDRRG